ncbi:MAG: hypothetical protein PQ612_06030 [Rickettsiales bacterium]|nr:hypothetical protein [Pseudomonadota bacterium]MDA0966882.1 hypothetical protein [Pseudomonadota bacterium]MDG4543557.1 hypothetical protein [Rickettsiales bacterium]MDG4545705.1 hypothetical protein [Rickettsiales bacterium]MDG4547522.1 hypothetical protein [Rickettsiales bacterium]
MKPSIVGISRLKQRIMRISATHDRIVNEILEQAALQVRNNAVHNVQNRAKSGKLYDWRALRKGEKADRFVKVKGQMIPVKDRKTPHRASAPGQSPAEDEGDMTKHIAYFVSKKGMERRVATIRGGYGAAKNLEFGSRGIKARPFLLPAFYKEKRKFRLELTRDVKRNIKKYSKK